MGYFLKRTNVDNEGFILPSGPTSDRPSTPIPASIRYNTDTQSIEYFNGNVYVDVAKSGSANVSVDKFTGDGITTTFTMSVEQNDWKDVLVHIDGLLQIPPGNFDVSGFDITFSEAPPLNRKIVVYHGLNSTYVQSGDVFDVPNL